MADKFAYLEGGKCDGKLHALTDAERNANLVVCKGDNYTWSHPLRHHNGHPVWAFFASNPVDTPAKPLSAPHALGGWKALRKSINRDMPQTLTYSHKLTTKSLRTLHRTRKVRV